MTNNQDTGANELLQELHLTFAAIASELKELRSTGSILGDGKKFDRVMQLIEKSAKIKALTSKEKDQEPEPEIEEGKPEEVIKKKRNIQDFVINNGN